VHKKIELLLIGAGGHCRSCIDIISCIPELGIAGVVDRDGSDLKELMGHDVIGTDSNLEVLLDNFNQVHIAVGQIKTPEIRINLFNRAKSYGAEFPVLVSPSAYLSLTAKIGEGTVLMHLTVVNSSAEVGKNCIINNKALIEHDSIIGPHCHISTGALVNGGVVIEDGCFVGSGAIIHEGVKIGGNSIIGAGQVVKTDIASNTVVK
jgi:sugar O-acyltransferase (sialic acid O-acetyltransferase NeuD family)